MTSCELAHQVTGQRSVVTIYKLMTLLFLFQDGRLKQNDLLLQINEGSVLNMNSDDVIGQLKAVSLAGQPIKLVLARAVDSPQLITPEFNDVSV